MHYNALPAAAVATIPQVTPNPTALTQRYGGYKLADGKVRDAGAPSS